MRQGRVNLTAIHFRVSLQREGGEKEEGAKGGAEGELLSPLDEPAWTGGGPPSGAPEQVVRGARQMKRRSPEAPQQIARLGLVKSAEEGAVAEEVLEQGPRGMLIEGVLARQWPKA